MRLTLAAEHRILLTGDGADFTIDGGDEPLSPFHLLAASLAACTFLVLQSWAHHAKLRIDDLQLGVDWDFDDEAARVSAMRMEVIWPSLPGERRATALRAAKTCTVHNSLEQGFPITTGVAGQGADGR
ncbi:MAG: OsmC family protein [Longimicrobiales bacterium]